jgi:hypothetical protein
MPRPGSTRGSPQRQSGYALDLHDAKPLLLLLPLGQRALAVRRQRLEGTVKTPKEALELVDRLLKEGGPEPPPA